MQERELRRLEQAPPQLLRRARAIGFLITAMAFLSIGPGAAQAAQSMSLSAGFASGTHLGEAATATHTLGILGSEYGGVPFPTTEFAVRFPKGTVLSSTGFTNCPVATLEPSGLGPSGCPADSHAGPIGTFHAYVSFGNERVLEEGTIEPFFSEGGIELFMFGYSPVLLEIVAAGHYLPATESSGPGVAFDTPLIETVPGAPDSSLTSIELQLGAYRTEHGEPVGSVTAPSECSGSLTWEASGKFWDPKGSEPTASADATSGCPSTGKRLTTTTSLSVQRGAVNEEEIDRYTATVRPSVEGATPSGTVSFRDEGLLVYGCEAVPLEAHSGESTASCSTYPYYVGSQAITSAYSGDGTYTPSESLPVYVTLSSTSTEETATKELEEERERAAARKAAEEAARKAGEAAARAAGEEAAEKAGEEAARRAAEEAASKKAFTTAATALASWLTPHGADARTRALLEHGSIAFTIAIPRGATATARWYFLPRHGGSKRVLVAEGTVTATSDASNRLVVKLTSGGRRLIEHDRKLEMTLVSELSSPSGGRSRHEKIFAISR